MQINNEILKTKSYKTCTLKVPIHVRGLIIPSHFLSNINISTKQAQDSAELEILQNNVFNELVIKIIFLYVCYLVRENIPYTLRVNMPHSVRVIIPFLVRVNISYIVRVIIHHPIRLNIPYLARVYIPYLVRVNSPYLVKVNIPYLVKLNNPYL